jgi:hypothetical protein
MDSNVPYNVLYSAQSFWMLEATPIEIKPRTLFWYTQGPADASMTLVPGIIVLRPICRRSSS